MGRRRRPRSMTYINLFNYEPSTRTRPNESESRRGDRGCCWLLMNGNVQTERETLPRRSVGRTHFNSGEEGGIYKRKKRSKTEEGTRTRRNRLIWIFNSSLENWVNCFLSAAGWTFCLGRWKMGMRRGWWWIFCKWGWWVVFALLHSARTFSGNNWLWGEEAKDAAAAKRKSLWQEEGVWF